MRKLLVSLVIGFLSFSNVAFAQKTTVYSWVDGKGARHYSDVANVPVSQVKSTKEVSVKRASSTSKEDGPSSSAPPSSEVAVTGPSAEDKKACQIAKTNQNLLSDSGRNVLSDDGKGVLTPEQRVEKLQKSNAQVEAFCNVLGGNN